MLLRLGFETAALDAKLLTGQALGLTTLELAMREQERVDDAAAQRVADLLQRRMSGESVARIIGEREFYGLAFALNAATLEPRPETELLVDMALEALPRGGRLLDLGTGTGCIPIAVLANRQDAMAVAVDVSGQALDMALENAGRHGVAGRMVCVQGSWFEALDGTSIIQSSTLPLEGRVGEGVVQLITVGPPPSIPPLKGEGRSTARSFTVPKEAPLTWLSADLSPEGRGGEGFDLIVSNPPYITSAVVETLAPEVRDFDPRLALDGGPDGLAPYRIIAAQAAGRLKPGGHVLVEIGYDQGGAVSAMLRAAGFADVVVHQDLNGLDRVVSAHHV